MHRVYNDILLSLEAYHYLYVVLALPSRKVIELGIPKRWCHLACLYYRGTPSDTERKRLSTIRRSMIKINKNRRTKPPIHLDRRILEELVFQGKRKEAIAKEMGTSVFLVERNLEYYGLEENCNSHIQFSKLSLSFVQQMENISPGFRESIRNFYKNKNEVFHKSYTAYLSLLEMADEIEETFRASWRNVRENHDSQGELKYISWSKNKNERILSLALMREEVPFQRQLHLGNNLLVDFYFPQHNLAVEIDGDHHTTHSATQNRDTIKNQILKDRGIKLIRFSQKEVRNNIAGVVLWIKSSFVK